VRRTRAALGGLFEESGHGRPASERAATKGSLEQERRHRRRGAAVFLRPRAEKRVGHPPRRPGTVRTHPRRCQSPVRQEPDEPWRRRSRTRRGCSGAGRVRWAHGCRVRVGRLANPADAEEPERGALHQCGRLPVRGHPAESSWMDACCAALRAFCALNSRVMHLRAQRTPQARSGQAACSLFPLALEAGARRESSSARRSLLTPPPPSRLLLRTRSSPLAAWFTRGLALSGAASSAVALLMALC
jgi:hypothetical protein